MELKINKLMIYVTMSWLLSNTQHFNFSALINLINPTLASSLIINSTIGCCEIFRPINQPYENKQQSGLREQTGKCSATIKEADEISWDQPTVHDFNEPVNISCNKMLRWKIFIIELLKWGGGEEK